MMAKILALDVGEKTVGVAISDESETFAFPRQTILRHEGHRRDMAAVRQMVDAEAVDEVVVGLPIMLNGTRGIQAEKAEAFAEMLKRFVPVPVSTQDERMSTREVERLMISADVRRTDRKQV